MTPTLPKLNHETQVRRTYENPEGTKWDYMQLISQKPELLGNANGKEYYQNPNSMRPIIEVDRSRHSAVETVYFTLKEMLWML